MYTVTVEARFSASHRVRYPNGTREPAHTHDWAVRAYFSRPELDEAGMVVDFEHARSVLQGIVAQLHQADLNAGRVLGGANPTAEAVARYVFERLVARGLTQTQAVAVTEAPGCVAIFERVSLRGCRTAARFDDG